MDPKNFEEYGNESDDENQIDSKGGKREEKPSINPLGQQDLSYANTNSEQIQVQAKTENVIVSLTADIIGFEEKHIEKNNVIFYKMQIGFTKNNKRWFQLKRYSDFDTLDKVLKQNNANLPSLPGKTFFKMS